MTLTNHLLTGAVIGKYIPWPLAIPLAFVSHFVLDALPHLGFRNIPERMRHLRFMRVAIAVDFFVAALISAWLITHKHYAQFFIGLIAYSPDTLWIYRFVIEEKFGTITPTKGNRFIQFHRNIQKYERMWGGFVEVIYAAVLWSIVR